MSSLQATHDGTTSNNRRHTSHSLELRAVPSITMEDLRNRVDARGKEALNIEDNVPAFIVLSSFNNFVQQRLGSLQVCVCSLEVPVWPALTCPLSKPNIKSLLMNTLSS
jgi:hypothetical protein